jgi:hypothetical protein
LTIGCVAIVCLSILFTIPIRERKLTALRAVFAIAVIFIVSPINLMIDASLLLNISLPSLCHILYISLPSASFSIKWIIFGVYCPTYTLLVMRALQFARPLSPEKVADKVD